MGKKASPLRFCPRPSGRATQHQIQVLHRRPRGALAQVVKHGGQQHLAVAGVAEHAQSQLLIRPCEVLSRVANVTILEVANNALRVLLQHRHVIIGSLA